VVVVAAAVDLVVEVAVAVAIAVAVVVRLATVLPRTEVVLWATEAMDTVEA